ncbi:DUF3817 domain-containing protein [Actinomadura hibisca]|uniref:DUF3817 domain-containing protein n=1 Tax=Actinomadura hibisca TaxID=68565 RepID=UPI0008371408|nr:DUF3817 domain-containing protein [Actinomadura hibisca]
MDIVRSFRLVSVVEAISFLLLLLVAMPLKYVADVPQVVSIVGPIHGVLWMAYVALVFLVRGPLAWDGTRTLLALVASVLPVAPFYVERKWTERPAERAQQPA